MNALEAIAEAVSRVTKRQKLTGEEQKQVEAWLPPRSPEEATSYVVTVMHPRSKEPLFVTVRDRKEDKRQAST